MKGEKKNRTDTTTKVTLPSWEKNLHLNKMEVPTEDSRRVLEEGPRCPFLALEFWDLV